MTTLELFQKSLLPTFSRRGTIAIYLLEQVDSNNNINHHQNSYASKKIWLEPPLNPIFAYKTPFFAYKTPFQLHKILRYFTTEFNYFQNSTI